jgi:Putative transposase/Transposase zinc-binding domain
MPRGAAEVADVFRRYGGAYRQQHGASLSTAQRRVMTAIERCRTAALGGHVEQCDACGHQRICYNSCRNRHCPKCQSLARAQWLEDRRSELLTTPYFHVVFTLPQEIAAIAHYNKGPVYNILFHAAAETLQTIAADPKHLGAELGFFAVLHTWGQTLLHHPHLHCVVAGGGLTAKPAPAKAGGSRWITCRPTFFLPVRVLARLFRRLLLASLQKAFDDNKLTFCGRLEPLRDRRAFQRHLAPARKAEWCVYAKPPFAGPEQVLAYVARYTHRVAISNNRLLDIDDGKVRFHWKDYRNGNRQKTMTRAADEFIRRFLLHVLPEGFQRIRYYGFLANRYRVQKLARCRHLLAMPQPVPPDDQAAGNYRDQYQQLTGISLTECPACQRGRMVIIEVLKPAKPSRPIYDTS